MWFFASPRNPYRETIEAKRTRRADALKHAPAFSAKEHQKFLDVTGNGFHDANYSCGLIFWRRSASQIVENISAGKWTASVVLEAYIARAAQAQEATNCLTEGTYRLCLDYCT